MHWLKDGNMYGFEQLHSEHNTAERLRTRQAQGRNLTAEP